MSAKCAFFGVLQKIMVVCCAIFFGFANAFSANLPSGYTELEYIESTGTQWIDTGITPRATKLQVNFKMQSLANTYQSFFGAVADPIPRNGYRIYRQADGSGVFVQSGSVNPTVAVNLNNPLECQTTVNNGGHATVVVNGVTSTVGSGMNTQFDRSMLIFTTALGSNTGVSGTGAFKLWSFQIIKDDEEKFNGVPAKRNSDNAIGLYDLVSGQFFTNAGTGTFTAGPAKCRNLFDKNTVTTASPGVSLSDYMPVIAGQPYYIGDRGNVSVVKEYDADKHYIQTLYLGGHTYTPSANTAFVRLNVSNSYLDTFQFEAGATATDYVPFCSNSIKIATTAYNAARFSPVVTDLNSAVATIREIVTNTINQTAAIASLQADKQTRPEDACPAGKKCLLVETEENGVIVPHWFPIIETPEDN